MKLIFVERLDLDNVLGFHSCPCGYVTMCVSICIYSCLRESKSEVKKRQIVDRKQIGKLVLGVPGSNQFQCSNVLFNVDLFLIRI